MAIGIKALTCIKFGRQEYYLWKSCALFSQLLPTIGVRVSQEILPRVKMGADADKADWLGRVRYSFQGLALYVRLGL